MTWAGGIALAVIVFVLAIQVLPRLQARRSRGKRVPELPGPLGEKITGAASILAVFTSPSCPACRAQAPIIDVLAQEFRSITPINVTEHPEIARAFGVLAVPTSVLIQRGTIAEVRVGLQPEQKLRKLLSSSPTE